MAVSAFPTHFIPNPLFDEEFQREPRTLANLAILTEEAVAVAKAQAPVATGAYRDSIGVRVVDTYVYLTATDFKAWWIEYGTALGFPPHATLRRAVLEMGWRLIESKT